MPMIEIKLTKQSVYEILSNLLYQETRCEQILSQLQKLRCQKHDPFLHERIEYRINRYLDSLQIEEFIVENL